MLTATTQSKSCRVCGGTFKPFQPLQTVCGLPCAKKVPVIDRKARKVDLDRRKEALKTRSDHQNETQKACNEFVRTRDAGLPCISCGRNHDGIWHAGHYRSAGSSPELRFDERNVHKQCAPCNLYLSGNLVLYRAALVRKIGLLAVEALEGPQPPKKYTVAELQAMKAEFRAKTRELLKANQ